MTNVPRQVAPSVRSRLPQPSFSFVCSVGIGEPVEQFDVLIEILPRELVDVVRKPFNDAALPSSKMNDAASSETIHHTIIKTQNIGFAPFCNVDSEEPASPLP